MRIALILVCIFALFAGRLVYCGSTIDPTITSAPAVQMLVVEHILDKNPLCMCSEIRVKYRVKRRDGFVAEHMAYYNTGDNTLRIETDLYSGWAFGWDDVDRQILQQVSQEGGQFSLFTKYRPNGRHVPPRMGEPF